MRFWNLALCDLTKGTVTPARSVTILPACFAIALFFPNANMKDLANIWFLQEPK